MLKPNFIVLTDQPDVVQGWIEDIIKRVVSQIIAGGVANTPAIDHLLTKEQACREFGVSKTTLTEWMKAGIVPFIRLGRRVYLERDQVMAAGRSHTKYKRTK